MLRIFQHHKKNKWRSRLETLTLWFRNRFSQASVVASGGVAVSLTTFGPRIPKVYIAIESIGRGLEKPGELVLWMSDKHRDEPLPRSLQRLVARGLTIQYCEDLGPHKKYYPYVASRERFDGPLVTADDDVIYPAFWLKTLVSQHRKQAAHIHCFRAHRMRLNAHEVAPYSSWPPCRSDQPHPCNFATGVSGVLYPAAFLQVLKAQGTGFMQCCPHADDIWLNVNALRHGFAVKQVGPEPIHFTEIRGTQQSALNQHNVKSGGNDAQIARTYGAADRAALLDAAAAADSPPGTRAIGA